MENSDEVQINFQFYLYHPFDIHKLFYIKTNPSLSCVNKNPLLFNYASNICTTSFSITTRLNLLDPKILEYKYKINEKSENFLRKLDLQSIYKLKEYNIFTIKIKDNWNKNEESEIEIFKFKRNEQEKKMGIIVLGAKVNSDGKPGKYCKARIDSAINYLKTNYNENTFIILTGSMVKQSVKTEADAMFDTIKESELKIKNESIILEKQAINTIQNGIFTKLICEEQGIFNINIFTSDFHCKRSLIIFKKIFNEKYNIEITSVSLSDEDMKEEEEIVKRLFLLEKEKHAYLDDYLLNYGF